MGLTGVVVRVSLGDLDEREAEGEIMVLLCKSFVFKCIALLRGLGLDTIASDLSSHHAERNSDSHTGNQNHKYRGQKPPDLLISQVFQLTPFSRELPCRKQN